MLDGVLTVDVEPDVSNMTHADGLEIVMPFMTHLSINSSAVNDMYVTLTRLVGGKQFPANACLQVRLLFKVSFSDESLLK